MRRMEWLFFVEFGGVDEELLGAGMCMASMGRTLVSSTESAMM